MGDRTCTDDCMISQVYETAEALGMKVTIDIQQK